MSTAVLSSASPQVEEFLPLLLQNMRDHAIFMVDAEGQILTWAPGVRDLLGFEAEEFIGSNVDVLLSVETGSLASDALLAQHSDEGRVEGERFYRRKDGSRFWGNHQVTTLRDHAGMHGFAIIVRDQSEHKDAQRKLQRSEEQLAAIFARAAVGLSEISREGRFLRVNDELCRMLGRSRAELLTLGVPEVTHLDDIEPSFRCIGRLLTTGEPASLDKRYLRPNGTLVWANSSVTILNHPEGQASTLLVVTVDLSDRKQAEIELRQTRDRLEERVEARTAELRAATEARGQLLHQLVTAQEEERRRIARELHDQLGQSLVALGLGLENLSTRLDEADTIRDLPTRLQTLNALTQGLMDQVHNLAWQLRPAELDELGLEAALRQVVGRWQESSGIRADFIASSSQVKAKIKPSIEIEVALYRVAQECLSNVARHAGAHAASVVLKHTAHEIAVIVEDDGRGFDAEPVNANSSKRLGVVGMRERLEIVGGTLTIETIPGSGTTIYARVPLTESI